MHQLSSKAIGRLAGALAKAQAELVNPKKHLTATIYADNAAGGERTFKYASLADGLDIVRKTLSQHSIAAVQTTVIDNTAQLVKLTTVLAHSSGEWISADLPVCGLRETEQPQRLGAALTYARRQSLFALVGIAGEDDLDAPEATPTDRAIASEPVGPPKNPNGRLNGNGAAHQEHNWPGKSKSTFGPLLGPAASAELRDRLVSQIAEIGSADDAALWAYCNMRAKNGLAHADALLVEQAFQTKLMGFSDAPESLSAERRNGVEREAGAPISGPAEDKRVTAPGSEPAAVSPQLPSSRVRPGRSRARAKSATGIDKAALAFPEPRRIRDREHVRFVATQPCLICGRVPSDPHHLRFMQSRALGRKPSDQFTIPLCRGHHREVHRHGLEADWWQKVGIDPRLVAHALWLRTHPLPAVGTVSDEQGSADVSEHSIFAANEPANGG